MNVTDRERDEFAAAVVALVRVGMAAVAEMPIPPTDMVELVRVGRLLRAGRAFCAAFDEGGPDIVDATSARPT